MLISYDNFDCKSIIKYVFMTFLYSNIIFFDFININMKKRALIEIDNVFNMDLYENDILFTNFKEKFKVIALYYPEYNTISYRKLIYKSKINKFINTNGMNKLLATQIKLAKNHGIYGFAIYFNLFKEDHYCKKTLDILLNVENFPFFLIWRNEELKSVNIKYINILINKKPVLSINEPSKITNIENIILDLRQVAKKLIGEIFILYPFVSNFKTNKFLREFDAIYDFSKFDLLENKNNNHDILYYSGIIYNNLYINQLSINFTILRTCFINYKTFKDFNPEKFYIANKIIFDWENNHLNQNEGYILLASWNDFSNGNYLEPDEKYGYSIINSFSKSILNLPFKNDILIINNNKTMVAIHIHAFYEDLLMKIINKINLMPIKYDLFVSTISEKKKNFIHKCLLNSTANKYEIEIFENKGRDVFPFLTQMKKKYKNYKYICHIHTKKSVHKLFLGNNWREYIYENLIGSKEIISNILSDFEKNEKLGFIFPEAYYDLIKGIKDFDNSNLALNIHNKKYMNYILKRIFKKFKVGEKLIFPVGNMFWARTNAIHQIFNIKFKFPKESSQENKTIMHAIERIWLYLVKLNGYYYKAIFKHY